jgi:hypothetical protein
MMQAISCFFFFVFFFFNRFKSLDAFFYSFIKNLLKFIRSIKKTKKSDNVFSHNLRIEKMHVKINCQRRRMLLTKLVVAIHD